jgi:hypothetical protein
VPLKQQKNGTWLAELLPRGDLEDQSGVAIDGYTDVPKQATLLFQKPRWLPLSEVSSVLPTDDTSGTASSITIRRRARCNAVRKAILACAIGEPPEIRRR